MSSAKIWDAIVVGAGPGGSSCATALAEGGADVLVVEREHFPRFHIGESLLPAAELITDRLGIEQDPNIFLFKRGAEFLCESTDRSRAFDFAEALPGPQRYAWHVDRPRFDKLLRDTAEEAGATIRHGERVEDVAIDDDSVTVSISTEGGAILREEARYVIDASGQDRLLAKQFDSVRPYDRFGKAAAFTHFSKLGDSARDVFSPNNDIRIIIVPDGWLWVIPLTGNRLSVGLVSRLSGLRERHLDDYLAGSPFFARVLDGAQRGETRLIGNFSFENARSHGARFMCVGDAACFIDPVFSSGVSLAIRRGLETADRLLPALAQGNEGQEELMTPVAARMQRGYDTFAGLVYRFYNTRFVDNVIFGASQNDQYRDGVISVLAGDVFREDNPFQDMLLASKRISIRSSGKSETAHA